MGLLQQASLVVTPNAYKASKLYSVIPTNGTGDLDVVRATSATRVNSAGLIEIPVTNLALQSDMFANATWVKDFSSISPNDQISPDGTLTADTFTASGTTNIHQMYQNGNVTSGITYTNSIFAKKGTNDFIQLAGGNTAFGLNSFANFDLNNGTVGTVGSTTTASIQNIGNGWYRCIVTFTAISTTTIAPILMCIVNSSSAIKSQTNNLSTSVYLWGAQVEQGVTATEYIPTTTVIRTRFAGITQDGSSASNIPRLDYTNASCPSILVEPQRTNIALWSDMFANATWNKTSLTVNANTTISPSGVQDADTITTTAIFNNIAQAITVTASTAYTFSFYALRGSMTDLKYSVYNLSGTSNIIAPTSYYSQTSASSWVRVSVTFTTPVGCTSINIYPIRDTGVTGTVFLWGAQLEAGSNATSYIPTTSASVTRNADVISKTGISSLIGQTQGTLYWEGRLQGQSFSDGIIRMLLSISDGTINNRIEIYRANNVIQYDNVVGGAIQFAAPVFTITDFTGQPLKLAITYTLNNVKVFINGVLINTDTTALIPACNQINIGSNRVSGSQWSGLIKGAVLLPLLTNTQAIQLTTL